MNYEKSSWGFGVDKYVPTTTTDITQWQLWQVAAFITGNKGSGAVAGRWTVYGSNNGTTAALDGVDRWNLATFTPANIVTNKAWIVLKSPTIAATNFYLIIDYINGGIPSYSHWVWCKAAPTGGTTTARPTSTDEWNTGYTQINVGVTYEHIHWSALASDGSFHVVGGYITPLLSQNYFTNFGVITNVMANLQPGDTYPLFTSAGTNNSYPGYLTGGGAFAGSNTIRYDSTHTATCALLSYGQYLGTSLSAFSGWNWMYSYQARDCTTLSLPIWCMSTASPWIVKGRLQDYYIAPLPIRDGHVEPLDGTGITFTKNGNMWMPSDTTPKWTY